MSTLRELAETVQAWHSNAISSMQTIVDAPKDAPIHLGEGEGATVLEADSDKAKGFRMGVLVAMSFVKDLPFSVDAKVEIDPLMINIMIVLVEHLGIDGVEPPSCTLRDDFGADDHDVEAVRSALQDKFGIQLDIAVEQLTTIQHLYDAVLKAITEKAGAAQSEHYEPAPIN